MMHTERNHIPSFATNIADNSNRNQTPPCDGVKSVRFCREMDSDNINAPCFSPKSFVLLSACE